MITLLIVLQVLQVTILWLHDWVPLPPLNDIRAVRAADSTVRLAFVTLLQSAPYTAGLIGTWVSRAEGPPHGLRVWLWLSYAVLLAGEVRAWWIPYLVAPDPARAARYRALFGATHAFLPERHGLRPNTLHVVLHGFTVATLVVLALLRPAT